MWMGRLGREDGVDEKPERRYDGSLKMSRVEGVGWEWNGDYGGKQRVRKSEEAEMEDSEVEKWGGNWDGVGETAGVSQTKSWRREEP